MIRSSIPEIAQKLLTCLPQRDHLNATQVVNYLNKMVDRGEDLQFISNRLGGIGGSEMAAILKHYYPIEFQDEHPFRDAHQIYVEKLMLGISPQLSVAERGKRIEPLIRDLFITSNKLSDCKDSEAMTKVRVHATNQYMLGNPDDIFLIDGTRVLPDYKSSCLESNEESPTHYIQLNQYAENCRSHGFPVDVALTVNLHAPEAVLQDLIRAYENRESDPDFYRFYKEGILLGKFSHIKYFCTPIKISAELGRLCSETIERFMCEYVIPGRPIKDNRVDAVFVGDELEKAEKINANIFHLKQLENAVETLLKANVINAKSLLDKQGLTFKWPTGEYPIDVKSAREINADAALQAAEMIAIPKSEYMDVHEELNDEKVKLYFNENNIPIPESMYAQSVNKQRLILSLKEHGLPVEMFYGDEKIQFGLSRKSANKDELMSSQIELQDEVLALCNSLAENGKINFSQQP